MSEPRYTARDCGHPNHGAADHDCTPFLPPPYRLCCMERHHGPNCADGKVMCCICFARFDVADLVTYPGDDIPSDVCKVCAKRDERAIREARSGGS